MRFVWTPIAILISTALVIGVFQNCTPAVPFGNVDYYSSLVNSSVYPYEAGFDQIAYMSCSEQANVDGVDDGTFFTFRVGAYDDLGLRISQDYRDSVVKVADEDVAFALQESTGSSGDRLLVALRSLDNLQAMYANDDHGTDGLQGFDYDLFFPPLGNSNLSETLWSMESGDYLRYYSAGLNARDYRFEGDLRFMDSEGFEFGVRSFLSNRGVIAVTFARSGEVTPVGPGSMVNLPTGETPIPQGSAPAADVNGASLNEIEAANVGNTDLSQNVFGFAVQPRFKQPLNRLGGSPGRDMPPRVLSSVSEIRIDDRFYGEPSRPWVCPDNMQFMIVMPDDVTYQDGNGNTIVRCDVRPDPTNPSPDLRRIRQSLHGEEWYIDMARRCVVPKADRVTTGSCYGKSDSTQESFPVNYDSFSSQGCGFNTNIGLCPHYASICFRQ